MVQFVPSFPLWQERDKKKSDQCLRSTRIIRNCQNGGPKHATANLPVLILSSCQNYCCSAILFASRLTSSENRPMMPKVPDHVPFQSTLPQDKALALLLQISRQSLLSPCSHSHSLLYLTYLEGREGCQACWWEKPKTNPVLQMSMLKAEQLQPPQILQANCVASLHLQGSRNTVPRPPAPLYWVEAEHHQLPRA